MTVSGAKRLNNRVAEMNDGHMEAYHPYLVTREALLKALQEFAVREFH